MINIDKLNPQQQEAVLYTDGPLLILAGAGSGKTATMIYRIAHLVKDKDVAPGNILAVTFTNKAAGEMRDRAEALTGENLDMWILTFHAACLRMLRRDADRLGYDRRFTVYDPADQKTMIKNIAKELDVDSKKITPAYILSIVNSCKEDMISPDKYIEINGTNIHTKIIYEFYKKYEESLRANNAMDFSDLLWNAVKLLEQNEDVLKRYQDRFRYIMVDEYQDTNSLQYKFVRLLAEAHDNICVVGDDDQCIYEWRGADIRNILEFEKDFPNAKVVKLEKNYRSTGNILEAAHSVISKNKSRKPKKLWTSEKDGEKIEYARLDNEKDEAGYVARRVDLLKTADRKYSDFAILYRMNAQSRNFEEAFSAADIPYRVLGGLRYYDRKEIKDIMCYMRLVQNPGDDLAFERIINEPRRGIGQKTLDKLRTLAGTKNESIFNALYDDEILASLSKKSREKVSYMIKTIMEYHSEQENMMVSDIYDGLLKKSGYMQSLETRNTVEADTRIENLLEFKSVIYDYEKENDHISLAEFMEKIALMAEIDNHDENENAVVMMTLHSAKGLEFPVVFMPGMEDGIFPGYRALEKPDSIEEERRLCYVGITRAMEKLFMTSAEVRTLYGSMNRTRESQFLKEIDKNCMTGDAVFETKNAKPEIFSDGVSEKIAYNPFEQMQKAKQSVMRKSGDVCEIYNEGDEVAHPKFGTGLVLEVDSRTTTVMFEKHGRKKLLTELANLKKI